MRTADAAEVEDVLRDIGRIARARWPWLSGETRRRVCRLLIVVVESLEGRTGPDELAARRAKR